MKQDDRPLLATTIESVGAIGEEAVTAHWGFLRRGQSARALGVLDWVDGAQYGTTRSLRSVNQRVDAAD